MTERESEGEREVVVVVSSSSSDRKVSSRDLARRRSTVPAADGATRASELPSLALDQFAAFSRMTSLIDLCCTDDGEEQCTVSRREEKVTMEFDRVDLIGHGQDAAFQLMSHRVPGIRSHISPAKNGDQSEWYMR